MRLFLTARSLDIVHSALRLLVLATLHPEVLQRCSLLVGAPYVSKVEKEKHFNESKDEIVDALRAT